MILWVAVLDSLIYLYILIFFMEFFSIVYMAARDASLPNLVEGKNRLTMANSMTMGSSYGSIPLAAALFALLVIGSSPFLGWMEGMPFFGTHEYSFSFIVDALTFFISAFMIARITRKLNVSLPQQEADESREEKRVAFFSSLSFAFRNRFMRSLTAALATGCVGGGALFAVGVIYVNEVLQGNDTQFGFLMALFGLGMVAGIIGLQFISRVRAKWFIFMAYVAALVFGAAFSLIFLTGITMIQEVIEDENRGKAFAAFHAISRIFLLVGAAIAAVLAGVVGGFTINMGVYHLEVWGVTIAMFAAGVLIASVAFLPIRERIEEQEITISPESDKEGIPTSGGNRSS
jgi:dTMP kinase